VTVTTTNKYSVITIVNYNSYNDKEDDQRPAKRPTKQPSNDQQSDTPATTNNNDKNVKNEKEVKDMCDFDEVWNALPARNNKKLEKPAAFTRYKQQALKDRPAILIAAKNYANSDLVKRGIGIKDPKRFLLNWQDWKEAETGKHTTTNLTEDEIDKALGLK
jgi:molecular chaperone GrpE (heat shock protein)